MYVVGQGNSSPKNTNKFCFVTDVPLPAAPPAARKLFVPFVLYGKILASLLVQPELKRELLRLLESLLLY